VAFYSELLGIPGTPVRGSRHYFNCGSVILAILDPSPGGFAAVPAPDNTYFSVANLEAIHARANKLGCLSSEGVHGASGADIVTRPWGERSFYAIDPFGNPLCFVDAATVFAGK
jgi:hypothetical protein